MVDATRSDHELHQGPKPFPSWWPWFALITPAASWSTVLTLNIFVTGAACDLHWNGVVRGLVIAFGLMGVIVSVVSFALAVTAWRRLPTPPLLSSEGHGRLEILVFAAVIVSAIFFFANLVTSLPAVILFDPCGAQR